ncbi:Pimeloyl-ACP methyl ester carboxylesterase [Pseudonocardia ammonioxydans]|uniref:Pimeloyl-ACP methyl ester carboxylesterase n=2 Tax=Pseudonocardia ammonioxydans TaxID=260086 RepID=A0A1I5FHJ1_PSUAM|nr:Pimeloyl-ACP methyl ester carboxylesterase [Pseudonocardia ammonioxydans]
MSPGHDPPVPPVGPVDENLVENPIENRPAGGYRPGMVAGGGQELRVRSRTGRVLTGASFGPVDGTPVLFVAGAATGRSMSFGREHLAATGVRLLTMDRPGMGGSSFDPERTVGSTAADYRDVVCGVLGAGMDAVPVVANSQGAVFGLAAALDGWVSSLTLVSPADEVAHPGIRPLLPREAGALADLALHAPEQARAVLGSFTPEAMEQMVLAGAGERDRDLYTSAEFLATYRDALREGFANNGAAYVQDTLLAMRPWGLDLSAVRCGVTVLFGAEDAGHSPDHGAILAARIPGARREVIAEAGGGLLWTHAGLVLDRVLERRLAP